jgi:hypothetical protein
MRATVRRISLERLFAGGLVGPVAACLCIVGFWHVYKNVRPEAAGFGRAVFVCFFALMVAGSAVHALWVARGLTLKYCDSRPSPCSELLTATKTYWNLAYNLGAVPGYFGAVLLAGLVLLKKTRYPRWAVLSNPAILILMSPLLSSVPSPFGAALVGGSANLSIAAFFLVSILTTWSAEGLPRLEE